MESFVCNPKLMNPLIKLTFLKSQVFDSLSVIKVMDLTAMWFLKIHNKGLQVPPDFDFSFFLRGLEMLLDVDHNNSTAKGIWLLYQIMHTVPHLERATIFKKLLDPKTFFKFMFHWSWQVRRSFHFFYYF
jgi:hypothetical protein